MRGKYVRIDSIQSRLTLEDDTETSVNTNLRWVTSRKSEHHTFVIYEYLRMRLCYVCALLRKLINAGLLDIISGDVLLTHIK